VRGLVHGTGGTGRGLAADTGKGAGAAGEPAGHEDIVRHGSDG